MAQWSLFVDESGRFDGNRISVVAGLLVPASGRALAPNPNHSPLRDRFARIWGPAPFPPHAGVYANAVGQALLAGIPTTDANRAHMLAAGDHAGRRRAAARPVLERLAASAFAARLDELRSGNAVHLSHTDVEMARRILEAEPASRIELEALDQVASDQRYEMNRLVHRVFERFPEARVVLVRSAPGVPPTAGPVIPGTRLVPDLYLDALQVVLERALRVLAPGDTLDLRVLTRDVHAYITPDAPTPTSLGAQLLDQLVEAVQQRVGTQVRVAVGPVLHYRDHARLEIRLHPYLVLADWIATTSAPTLKARHHTLATLEQDLGRKAVPPRALRAPIQQPGLGELPLTAHAGPAHARVAAALRGEAAPPPPFAGPPPWAAEQCEAWVTAVGGAA